MKQYSDALGKFQQAQKLLPGDTESSELVAEVTKKQTDSEAASGAQKKAAELRQALSAGRIALNAERFDDAQAAADRAVKIEPNDANAKKLLADVAEAKRASVAALQKKELLAKKSAQVDALLDKAREALRAKNLEQASRWIADASEVDATDPDIKKAQAEYEAVRRSMANAAETNKKQTAYETAIKAARDAMEAGQNLDDAIAQAGEALRLKPGDVVATQLLAAARKSDKSADSAAMEAKKKQEAYLTAMKNASAAFAAKKYETAISQAKVALANKPGDAAASKLLSDAQKADATADSAAMDAQKKKEAYEAAIKLGRAAMTRKDYAAAEKAFADALKAIPSDPQATAFLKQAREAASDMAEMAKRKELYDQWMDRAKTLMMRKIYDDAIEAYQNALKVIPKDPAATAGLTAARSAMNAKNDPPKIDPKPKVDPKPKIDPKPKVDPGIARIAALMKDAAADEAAGKYAEAYQTYQDVLKLSPNHAEAKKQAVFCQWMDQGKRQLAGGKLAEAAVSFDQALKIDPTDANAKRLLAQTKPKKK